MAPVSAETGLVVHGRQHQRVGADERHQRRRDAGQCLALERDDHQLLRAQRAGIVADGDGCGLLRAFHVQAQATVIFMRRIASAERVAG